MKQIVDIEYILSYKTPEQLPEGLYDMALTRLEYPHASLLELGELLTPKIGKSGVNHRLRKLAELAEQIRKEREHYD